MNCAVINYTRVSAWLEPSWVMRAHSGRPKLEDTAKGRKPRRGRVPEARGPRVWEARRRVAPEASLDGPMCPQRPQEGTGWVEG